MPRRPYSVLVLDDDPLALHQMVSLLKERDYVVNGAHNVEQARWWLSIRPVDLLIAAAGMRGAGLQFIAAARGEHAELASILVAGERTQQLEMAAWRYGAALVTTPYEPARFLMLVAEALASIRRRQRWPRKRVPAPMPLKVCGAAATLLNVSYGGLGFALEGETYNLPASMTIEYPPASLSVTAELVWSSRSSDGSRCVCGATVVGETDTPPPAWRSFVDQLPQA
jgi:DNA-binding response OmpR family regulator